MKNLDLNLKAVVESRSDIGTLLSKPGDAVIIQRGQPRWMMLKCPCGCGEDIPINLDRRAGKAWRYYQGGDKGVTLYPSVWRDTGCESHFIVWRGRILLMGGYVDDDASSVPDLPDLIRRVRMSWPSGVMISYVDVADKLGEIPWDVLEACRHLTREDVFVEGSGQQRAMFRRR
ncbi:MAG: hypothetical protein KGO02_25180 [Alphaproteobacteria bacterium]|nr:hypothetical protein [Alphaproteobacteria bacterium]